MKKLSVILSVMFIFAFAFTLAGCQFNPNTTEQHTTHTYSTEWTYDETGHWHECTYDGCTQTSDYAVHTFESSVTAPTYTAQGYTTYTCSVCGYNYKANYTDALEHNYDTTTWAHNSLGHYHACTDEGYEDLYTDFEAHTWNDGVVNENEITYTCTTCGETLTSTMLKATFACDEHVSVLIYNTQDVSGEGTSGTIAYARDGDSGLILDNGDGQVNFKVVVDDGYVIDEISITPNNYKNLKSVSTNCYRITKITGDITVNITTKEYVEEYDFEISCVSGTANCYTIEENSNGEYIVTFSGITSKSSYSISGQLNGNIVIDENISKKFELILNGVTITSSYESPIVSLASNDITITAAEGTTNTITDNRTAVSDDTQHSAIIYVTSDLTLAGTGTLNVTSTNNNGIHTKDDLVAKDLTLTVNCKDNALKGNDSVTISSGTYTLIAKQGDGIKSSNSVIKYEDDGVTIKKIQGTIAITGGTVNIYAACDGIDASYNAEISGDTTVVNINTSTYSSYSETVPTSTNDTFYVRATSTDYSYSIYYYDTTSGEYIWKNHTGYKKVTTESTGGRPGGAPGGSSTSYYYYEFDWLADDYSTFRVYVYTSSQTQGQDSSYYKRSDSFSTTTTRNTIAFSSSFSSSLTTYSDTDYSRKGIKADNQVNISGGTIVIKSYDDAIHANNDTVLGDEDDTTDDYYGDGIINISGGNITVTTKDDGIHADQDINISGGTITVLTSYEGIEANRIYVTDGTITVYATDDAMNAAECNGAYIPLISISGGYVDLDVASGDTDTMDSNGNITISGGTVVIKNRQSNGSSMTGGTLDLDGTLSITGGNVISIGCWCNEASMTSQASSTSTTLSRGNYTIKNSSGTEICSFSLATSYKGYRIYCYGKSGTYYLYRGTTQILSF